MTELAKIPYYDLKLEQAHNRMPEVFGRTEEIARLIRIVSRNVNHNALVTGPSGVGKTSLLMGFARSAGKHALLAQYNIVLLDNSMLQKISLMPSASLGYYLDAVSKINHCIVIIDSFGDLISGQPSALQNWSLLLQPLSEKKSVRLILSSTQQQVDWLRETNASSLLNNFETIPITTPPENELFQILANAPLAHNVSVDVPETVYKQIIKFTERFPALGQLPKAGIELLDESVTESLLAEPKPNEKNNEKVSVSKEIVEKIVSEKTGIPLSKLSQNEKEQLKNLGPSLNKKVIGQTTATATIVSFVQRARLGLRNPNRPLGSFLMLGPSGVGKTETAKILATEMYGQESSFIRIDMSEFAEAHTVSRLVGSPAGYVGYEEGGQLTNHFVKKPYSLVLLDEIEKAHPKVFDIFLQILDDGRLTSGRGETANFTQGIVMATSNLGVQEILAAFERGDNINSPEFVKEKLMPVLLRNFRPEFINRFDSLVVYKPLTIEDLVSIAMLEISKIEERVKEHNIKFNITREVLEKKIASLYDPRFGARPVKRFVEEVCETLITKTLLK